MIPSNGLTRHVSHQEYWPIYEEAEKLDSPWRCTAALRQPRVRTFAVFPATRALGMPFPLAIAATGIIVDGVFDAFPAPPCRLPRGRDGLDPAGLDRLERERMYSGLSMASRPKTTSARPHLRRLRGQREGAGLRRRARRPRAVHVRVRLPPRDRHGQLHGGDRRDPRAHDLPQEHKQAILGETRAAFTAA